MDRMELIYETLPLKLNDRSDEWLLSRTAADNWCHLIKHQEYVYHKFLIQRTLVKRLRVASTQLMKLSKTLLSSVLLLVGYRHLHSSLAKDLPWIVSTEKVNRNSFTKSHRLHCMAYRLLVFWH